LTMISTKKSPPSPWTAKLSHEEKALGLCRLKHRPVTIGEVALHLVLSLDKAEILLDAMAEAGSLVKICHKDSMTPLFRCT